MHVGSPDSGHIDTGAPESISAVLRRLGRPSADPDRKDAAATNTVTLGELIDGLDRRAYGLVLLLLAAPNLTPGPSIPGFSTAFGVPLCFIAAQMVLGRTRPWLPRRLARIALSRPRVAALIERALPLIVRVEYVLRPRLVWLTGPFMARWLGTALVVLGAMLSLPIPVYSMLPALAILLVAFGLLAHDGLAVVIGLGAGLIALGALGLLAWLAIAALGWA